MAVSDAQVIEGFDPLTEFRTPQHRADPHPRYHGLRADAPVLFVPEWDEFILFRHADCEAVLRDHRFSSNPQHRRLQLPVDEQDVRTRLSGTDANVLLFIDPPDHTRIRRLVSKAFTARRVEEMRPHIQEIVDGILDDAQDRRELDAVMDLGYQLPVTVICEMLGVPKEDRHLFHEWSAGATRLLDGAIPADVRARALDGAMHIVNYLNGIIAQRRRSPGDDLLSALITAEEEGETLTEEELRSMSLLLFVAGHETTMNLIGNGTHALLRHPDELERLRNDPGLIRAGIEELLRFDGPVHLTGRTATADLEVAGVPIERGQAVITLLAAANRDPSFFEDPDRLDVSREPNPHLTFSQGIHYCLGASLARVEAQVAIGSLVQRFPNLELMTDPVRYRDHFILRGLEELRVGVA